MCFYVVKINIDYMIIGEIITVNLGRSLSTFEIDKNIDIKISAPRAAI